MDSMPSRTARQKPTSQASKAAGDGSQRTKRHRVHDKRLRADQQLAERCLSGDTEAWKHIYDQCHPLLLTGVRHILGAAGKDLDMVDEIAARVWYALVRDRGRLLARYDAKRGTRLSDFCIGVAHVEILRHLREERRRQRHERTRGWLTYCAEPLSESQLAAAVHEFAVTLTNAERQFMEQELTALSSRHSSDQPLSRANVWQRCHRIRVKLKKFLAND